MEEAILDVFLRRLQRYNLRSAYWIYPGEVKRVTDIDIKTIYAALMALEVEGIVESCIEIYCPNCGRTTGHIYRSLSEIETEEIICRNCEADVSIFDHHAIIFKLLVE